MKQILDLCLHQTTFQRGKCVNYIHFILMLPLLNYFSDSSSCRNFVGPSLGGLVVHLYSFEWSVTVIGGIQVVVAIIVALFTLGEFCCQKRRVGLGFLKGGGYLVPFLPPPSTLSLFLFFSNRENYFPAQGISSKF